jgi:uncharacterized damage-inducible protein DinB
MKEDKQSRRHKKVYVSELEAMLKEFREEAATTRRVLERVPTDKLAWRPHDRSMSLGQLAFHIAVVPAGIVDITRSNIFDVSKSSFTQPMPASMDEVHAALEQTIRIVEQTLGQITTDDAHAEWHLMFGDQELQCIPKVSVWRSLMLNHWYHHRGQLVVYLRMLDVPVPSIYGPSADESPFFGKVTSAA